MNKIKELYENYPFPNDKNINGHEWILNTLDEFPKGNILDIGCGTGEISYFLSRFGNVTGIDFSENSIKLAKNRYKGIKFIVDDITKIKERGKYDIIFIIGVLHHIPNIKLALINIKKCMNKNTDLIVVVYSKYANIFYKRSSKNMNKARFMDTFHHPYAMYYSQKGFKNILEENGLKVIKIWKDISDILRLITGRGHLISYRCRLIL